MQKSKIDRYSRQIVFDKIGEAGQNKLLNSRVAIIGCGGLGTVIANNLARAGIGYLRIVDRDFVELDNLHRQMLFDEDDANNSIPKAIAVANKLKEINSTIEIESKVCDVNYRNVEDLIKDVDVVLDGLDNMEGRFLLNEACIKNNIPWVYGAAIGAFGSMMSIIPGKSACLRCVIDDLPSPGSIPTCEIMGVINTIVNIVASFETTWAMKILLNNTDVSHELFFIDAWETSFDKVHVNRRNNCPVCVRHEFNMLSAKEQTLATAFCGRDTIQIMPQKEVKLSLGEVKMQLEKLGEISFKGYLLSFKIEGYELIIFPDARVIIKGTRDESIARSLYAKYIGI